MSTNQPTLGLILSTPPKCYADAICNACARALSHVRGLTDSDERYLDSRRVQALALYRHVIVPYTAQPFDDNKECCVCMDINWGVRFDVITKQ